MKKFFEDGTVHKYRKGRLHSLAGAAIIYSDGTKRYYVFGIHKTEKEFKNISFIDKIRLTLQQFKL